MTRLKEAQNEVIQDRVIRKLADLGVPATPGDRFQGIERRRDGRSADTLVVSVAALEAFFESFSCFERRSPTGRPLVTVAFKTKWYGLTILHPEGGSEEVPFPDEFTRGVDGSPYLDHVPNPAHVASWAKRMGYDVDPLSWELIVGRWQIEYREDAPECP